ncbi:hypothetical protein [Candidatus Enterococcus clewellii]|uniref:Uncharacterized protein n=1 Tax=Candidatus Enterococcus clewellii TaxID=1834193 RepID=A0A242KA77_9ENTE|nr:hypothetical protein [Enterococcus sp. 9E7_DIV0242]OTP17450.1 hypothetical protein A5888_001588 [Enterococcus sp. 9E7_DIV0242]
MKIYSYYVEAIAIQENQNQKLDLVVKVEGADKNKLFDVAKKQAAKMLQHTQRITICWFEQINHQTVSKYDRYCEYRQSGLSKNQIRSRLKLSFKKFKEFEKYYDGKTKRFTFGKYKELRNRNLPNEVIRKRYEIPTCVFYRFIRSHERKLA